MASRAARTVLSIAALIAVVVGGTWLLLPWFISSDVVRTAIERELTDIVGQEVVVEGDVDIDLFPVPTARLYDLHMQREVDSEGVRKEALLAVDMVEVAIPFSSLVSRNPGFSQFRLVRPTIRVPAPRATQPQTGKPEGRLARALADIRRTGDTTAPIPDLPSLASGVGSVTVENGTIEFLDLVSNTPEKISALTGTVSWPRFDGRLSVSLNGIWRGAAFQQTAEIDQAISLFADRITGVKTAFSSDVLNYTFDGRLNAGSSPFAEGSVTFASPSLRQALDWLQAGIEPGRAIGDISLKGTVRGDPKRVRFENADIVLQGSSGSGFLEFAFGDAVKPTLTATLDFLDLDILSYLSAFTGFPRNAAGMAEPVSTAFIDQLDVDLRLSAARAAAGPVTLTEVAAVTQIRNGEALFEMADATALGGGVQARFSIGRKETGLLAELGISADAVDGGAFADALKLNGLFPRGRLSGNINIKSQVETWSDLFAKARGAIELRVSNGQIRGFSGATLLGDAGNQRFFRLQDTGTAETFQSLFLQASVQEGVIIIDKCAIDYPAASIEVNGVIPYGTASVALTTVASRRDQQGAGAPPVVQHFIGGSWTNPYATPVLVPQVAP